MQVLIVGNGIAGFSCAQKLRQLSPRAEITLISKEYKYFFARTALMYEFCGQETLQQLEPVERSYYDRNNIKVILDHVIDINPEQSTITLKNQTLNYDYLVLACGSVARQIPWQKNLDNVANFVTLSDSERLKKLTQTALSNNSRATVIGGGLIGVEVAEILAHAGLNVDFLVREKWYWPVALNEAEAEFVAKHVNQHQGINMRLGIEAQDVEVKDNSLTKLKLNTGEELATDFAAVCVGVTPATSWLENQDIKLSDDQFKAIEANDYLQTKHENIFTCGDCANVNWFNGVRRPEQIWYTGRDQGRIVAKNIFQHSQGQDLQTYQRGVLYNSSKLFDIEYTTAGLVNFPLDSITEWYQKIPNENISQRIVLQNDRVIGFNMLGSRWNHAVLIKWIEEKRDLEYVLEHMEDGRFDCEFTPKFKVLPEARQYAI